MTYKTRQEVLRAAADWMDVCEKAGVVATCKYERQKDALENMAFDGAPEHYEFPLALLEGKEVWVGSELYDVSGRKHIAPFLNGSQAKMVFEHDSKWSWSRPKPKTVMVEMLVEDAQWWLKEDFCSDRQVRVKAACKKALENLK